MSLPQLLAVVSVAEHKRVHCQYPGCGKPIYARIHVISDEGTLKVIGSTCIQKYFGNLGDAAYTSGGGTGKMLSDSERETLVLNTQQLVEMLKSQHMQAQDSAKNHQSHLSRETSQSLQISNTTRPHFGKITPQTQNIQRPRTPWTWVDPSKSMLMLQMRDGNFWFRVQAKKEHGWKHHLVPYPLHSGWRDYLPGHFGIINKTQDGIELIDLIGALQFMRSLDPLIDEIHGSFPWGMVRPWHTPSVSG